MGAPRGISPVRDAARFRLLDDERLGELVRALAFELARRGVYTWRAVTDAAHELLDRVMLDRRRKEWPPE
jgi:hypothetical protein